MTQPLYAITISFADHRHNAYLELGGAAWPTQDERDASWRQIPALVPLPGGAMPSCFLADRHAPNDDIEDTKCIAAETVEAVLAAPLAVLLERARQRKSAS